MEDLKAMASQIRRDIVRMVHGAASGHPGGSLGCADFFTALYFKIMKHDPKFNMDGTNEDVFFLSNGHISPVFYATLARTGYFDIKELATFRKINSRLQGHPATHEHLPGVRVASGSLGQGLSVAIGAALAKKLNGENFKPLVSLTTKKIGDIVEIRVKDNGMGMSKPLLDKIYDPFFTTKPSGHGTGLGLSLSYEIITKAHNGELKVETAEGEFAEFIIRLPT